MTHLLVVDGRRVGPGEPAVAGDDAGLLGHGAYESLRTYDRRPFAVDRHLERLAHGLRLLGIDTGHDDLLRWIEGWLLTLEEGAPGVG